MAIQQDWDKSRLVDYLLYDYWHPYNAWRVLAGLDYFPPANLGIPDSALDDNKSRFEVELGDYESAIIEMNSNVDRLRDFWLNAQFEEEARSPAFIIEWALSKRFRPTWLDWAIERGLYTPKQLTGAIAQTDFDKENSTYPKELDFALQAWRKVSTTEGKGKPKARIRTWLNNVNNSLPKENKLSKDAIERIAIVANWDKTGGATRSD